LAATKTGADLKTNTCGANLYQTHIHNFATTSSTPVTEDQQTGRSRFKTLSSKGILPLSILEH
jgi:hypothetical protein